MIYFQIFNPYRLEKFEKNGVNAIFAQMTTAYGPVLGPLPIFPGSIYKCGLNCGRNAQRRYFLACPEFLLQHSSILMP